MTSSSPRIGSATTCAAVPLARELRRRARRCSTLSWPRARQPVDEIADLGRSAVQVPARFDVRDAHCGIIPNWGDVPARRPRRKMRPLRQQRPQDRDELVLRILQLLALLGLLDHPTMRFGGHDLGGCHHLTTTPERYASANPLMARVLHSFGVTEPDSTSNHGDLVKLFECERCAGVLFFENTLCRGCNATLGYCVETGRLTTLPDGADAQTPFALAGGGSARYRQCRNYADHDACNWLVSADDDESYCRSCRLTEIVPDLSDAANKAAWFEVEGAKRRLLYTLYALRLPVVSKREDEDAGVTFRFLHGTPEQPVMTGHDRGIITLNMAEADTAFRENMREKLGEGYRTVLGHLRHEIGHYYWDRLIQSGPELDAYRAFSVTSEKTTKQPSTVITPRGRRATGPSFSSAPTRPCTPGRTGRNRGRTTCTCSIRWKRPRAMGSPCACPANPRNASRRTRSRSATSRVWARAGTPWRWR